MCSFVLGLGFGLALVPDMFLAFLLWYSVGFSLLPWGLGVRLRDCQVDGYPGWRVASVRGFAVAFMVYGFHASAQCLEPE